jgi:hypothetical protein
LVLIFVSRFLSQIETTGWLQEIRKLLKVTAVMVLRLQTGDPIVLESPDGRNVPEQLSSLVQLCLDPYFRTITGFAVLIEKEWVNFGTYFSLKEIYSTLGFYLTGHKWGQNNPRKYKSKQLSPIFIQFLGMLMSFVVMKWYTYYIILQMLCGNFWIHILNYLKYAIFLCCPSTYSLEEELTTSV